MSELPHAENRTQLLVGENRTVAADEGRAELAVAAEADGAFHVALHGDVYGVGRDPGGGEPGDGKSHHHLRTADQGDGMRRIEGGAGYQRGDDADAAAPIAAGMINGDGKVDVEAPAPALELVLEQDVVGPPHPDEEDDAPE